VGAVAGLVVKRLETLAPLDLVKLIVARLPNHDFAEAFRLIELLGRTRSGCRNWRSAERK